MWARFSIRQWTQLCQSCRRGIGLAATLRDKVSHRGDSFVEYRNYWIRKLAECDVPEPELSVKYILQHVQRLYRVSHCCITVRVPYYINFYDLTFRVKMVVWMFQTGV